MNENDINANVENEEVKKPIYSSKFLMNKENYYDFSCASYNQIKELFLLFFCLFTYLMGMSFLNGAYDITIGVTLFASFVMILLYLMIKRSIKIGYERILISEGREMTLNYELFDYKIVSSDDERKREYFYAQVTGFLETKNFLLLHLKHNLYLAIEKNNLNASVDEVKAFLMKKCIVVKNKKFINCANDKKWSLVLLIAQIVVSVVGVIVALILKINSIF